MSVLIHEGKIWRVISLFWSNLQLGIHCRCHFLNITKETLSNLRWLPHLAYLKHMAMRFELATRRVTSPDSEIFTPFELQVNFTQKMLALPYQKYTFSERKFDEEFKYGFENEVGWGTNILWLKLFRFCGPQNQIFLRAISLFPIIRFISPQHIWIPHQISFQKIYNYMILLIFIM